MTVSSKIGRYEVRKELGRGGMATVYLAHDPNFQRDVAVKVLPREFLHDPTFRSRFTREAQTIAALEHQAIIPVYDFGEQEGQLYLVMRYLSGGDLTGRLKPGPLPLAEIVRILNRLAPALDQAHKLGIIHRDLKPANILFDQYNDPFITDFGIAKLSQESSTLHTGNAIMGTPAYMSPEQASGDVKLDGRSDIYALGVMLFEMLTGRLPYQATTPIGLLMKHMTEPIPRLSTIKPDLPPRCELVVAQALAKDRSYRYTTAAVMADAFNAAVLVQPLTTPPPPVAAETHLWEKVNVPYQVPVGWNERLAARRQALEEKETRQRKEKLQRLINDLGNTEHYEFALYQLKNLGDEAIDVLIETLSTQSNPATLYGAAKAFGQLYETQRLKPLIKARAVKALIKVLANPEPKARYWAAHALGKFRDQTGQVAIEPLTALLKDPQPNVREQARLSLQQIKGKRA